MTGPDFIVVVAEQAAAREQPFAYPFLMMAQQAALGHGVTDLMITEAHAVGPLEADEASAVSIILGAYELARQEGDAESVTEVLRVGMALLAKWAEYLALIEQHPRLSLGGDDFEA